jgi:hypothetical protein
METPGAELMERETWAQDHAETQGLPLVMIDLAAMRKQAWRWMEDQAGLWRNTEEGGLREADAPEQSSQVDAVAGVTGNRRERRISVSRPIRIDLIGVAGADTRCEAELTDGGTRGIGFTLECPISIGQQLCLRLQHDRRRVALLYEVRHVRKLAGTRVAAGAELIGHIGQGLATRPERLLVMLMMGKTPPAGRRLN